MCRLTSLAVVLNAYGAASNVTLGINLSVTRLPLSVRRNGFVLSAKPPTMKSKAIDFYALVGTASD